MFIGHFGVGLGAKKSAPKISLGTLFLSAQFLDLLWPTFLLLGWEHVKVQPGITKMTPLNFTDYPLSHSLVMACVWGIVIGGIYFLIKRKYRGALILGLCAVSHWILDLIVHRPDLPLYPGGSIMAGFGLWNYPAAEIIVEGLIFFIGLWLYVRSTESKNKVGTYGFWGLIIFLILVHAGNIFGSPPPNATAIAWVGESQWILIIWAYWIDHNRSAAVSVQPQPASDD
ncbi:MAG TPA: hypothetical protein VJ964_13780 [Balneolaceae bacterium]|nr:hypothetical protein [Balneolaceae bacterium]